MREMLHVTAALVGEGLGDEVALITDGPASRGRGPTALMVGHIAPEGRAGAGPIGALRDGDTIELDVAAPASWRVLLSDDEIEARLAAVHTARAAVYDRGLLGPLRAPRLVPRPRERLLRGSVLTAGPLSFRIVHAPTARDSSRSASREG